MNKLPQAKTQGIVVQPLQDEVLIYNLKTDQAFCLNETSAVVYNHCNGATSFDELKKKYKFSDDLIYLALDELKKRDLLDDYQADHFAGMSRREVIRKVGLATMVALPVISSLVAPQAAQANSRCTANRCVAANTNICIGCTGRRVTYRACATNGSATSCSPPTCSFVTSSVNCSPGSSLFVNRSVLITVVAPI